MNHKITLDSYLVDVLILFSLSLLHFSLFYVYFSFFLTASHTHLERGSRRQAETAIKGRQLNEETKEEEKINLRKS